MRKATREVRAKAAASRSAQEPGERDQEPGELSRAGRPGRAGDPETPIEDEDLVEQGVEQRHGERDSQRDDRPGDAVEEAEHRHRARCPVARRACAETSTSSASFRVPSGMPNGEKIAAPAEGEGRECGNDGERGPERGPCGLRGAAIAPPPYACATRVCTDMPTPPNSSMNTSTGQYTAPMAEVAAGREPADEPSVRRVQHRLHGAVQHERHRQRRHGGIVEAEAPARRSRADREGVCSSVVQAWVPGNERARLPASVDGMNMRMQRLIERTARAAGIGAGAWRLAPRPEAASLSSAGSSPARPRLLRARRRARVSVDWLQDGALRHADHGRRSAGCCGRASPSCTSRLRACTRRCRW